MSDTFFSKFIKYFQLHKRCLTPFSHARLVYGVVIDPGAMSIDIDGTDALRVKMRAAATDGPDPQPAYLRLFHEPLGITDFTLTGERYLEL